MRDFCGLIVVNADFCCVLHIWGFSGLAINNKSCDLILSHGRLTPDDNRRRHGGGGVSY